MNYGPYGEPDPVTGWGGARFRTTGQATLPGAQLYHYKARVYNPRVGRFMQTDPIGYQDQMNLYAYVGNDPANATDPSGLCSVRALGIAGIASAGDGPLPVGEVIGAGVLIGNCGYRAYRFVTVSSRIEAALASGDVSSVEPGELEREARSRDRAAASLRRQAQEHREKLDNYRRDPDRYDNAGSLRRAGTDEARRRQIIDGRIRDLDHQIATFERDAQRAEAAARRLRELAGQAGGN